MLFQAHNQLIVLIIENALSTVAVFITAIITLNAIRELSLRSSNKSTYVKYKIDPNNPEIDPDDSDNDIFRKIKEHFKKYKVEYLVGGSILLLIIYVCYKYNVSFEDVINYFKNGSNPETPNPEGPSSEATSSPQSSHSGSESYFEARHRSPEGSKDPLYQKVSLKPDSDDLDFNNMSYDDILDLLAREKALDDTLLRTEQMESHMSSSEHSSGSVYINEDFDNLTSENEDLNDWPTYGSEGLDEWYQNHQNRGLEEMTTSDWEQESRDYVDRQLLQLQEGVRENMNSYLFEQYAPPAVQRYYKITGARPPAI